MSYINQTLPYVTFSDRSHEDKVIQSRGSLVDTLSGVRYENTGSVLVTVYDAVRATAATINDFRLTSASIGEIDSGSFKVVSSPTTVQFNVDNINTTGSVILSSYTSAANSALTSDKHWYVGSEDNDRLINLTEFLPSHLKGETIFEFVEFFEKLLNTMYDSGESTNHGILKKIERLSTLHNPEDIDIEFIQYFANMMGYDIGLNAGDLGLFVIGTETPTTSDEVEARNKALRFVVRNLPNWYRIKTTRNAIKIMLYSFGIVGDILYQYSDDYKENWVSYDEDPAVNIKSIVPLNFYPTPHFSLKVDIGTTTPAWVSNIDNIINAINSIRPINSVFDYITAAMKITIDNIEVSINIKTLLTEHISHTGPTWSL